MLDLDPLEFVLGETSFLDHLLKLQNGRWLSIDDGHDLGWLPLATLEGDQGEPRLLDSFLQVDEKTGCLFFVGLVDLVLAGQIFRTFEEFGNFLLQFLHKALHVLFELCALTRQQADEDRRLDS